MSRKHVRKEGIKRNLNIFSVFSNSQMHSLKVNEEKDRMKARLEFSSGSSLDHI